MRPHAFVSALALMIAGVGLTQTLYQLIVRPTVQDGALIVLDERPVALNAQFTLSLATTAEADMTLLTVVDPTTSTAAAAIEPVANGLSMERVMQLLAQARPEATIREIRVKREQNMTLYEVDFSDNFRLKMNAADGQMLSLEPISSRSSQPPPHRRVQGLTAQTTLLDAVAVAQQRQPEAAFKDAKLEIHDSLLVYKVKFEGGIDVFVDATTGQHLFTKLPRGQYDTSSLPISPEEALQAAQALFPNATAYDWKVKLKRGTVIYELKLSNRTELYISAMDGAILEVESEDD